MQRQNEPLLSRQVPDLDLQQRLEYEWTMNPRVLWHETAS
jgi:hypothetical protein